MREVSIKMVREKEIDYGIEVISSPNDVYTVLNNYIGNSDRERLVVICLDVKNNINAINTVSVGNISSSICHPREVFKPAFLSNSAAIILGHNHPSGSIEPSEDDIKITKKIAECGELLDVTLLDHIIIGYNSYCSLKEEDIF